MMTILALVGFAAPPATATAQHHDARPHGEPSKEGAAKPPVPACPVTGAPVNLAVSVETADGPVFFCCKDCISKYQADAAGFAAQVAEQRTALAGRPKVQVTCPVSGKSVDTDVFIESDGTRIYFCCKNCLEKYQADPAKYASGLANSYTHQTLCPVMREEIDPEVFTETSSGTRIYYCCKECDKDFHANFEKFAPNLAAQGYSFSPSDMKHSDGTKKRDHAQEHGAESGHGQHGQP